MRTYYTILTCLLLLLGNLVTAQQNIYFSTYLEGSGNDKALEIYNASSRAVNLDRYVIETDVNGKGFGSGEQVHRSKLKGTLEPNSSYLMVQQYSTNNELKFLADTLIRWSILTFNGNEQVRLLEIDQRDGRENILDQLGYPGSINNMKDMTLVRKSENAPNFGRVGATLANDWIKKPFNDLSYLKLDRGSANFGGAIDKSKLVGSISGKFDVSPTGASTYTVPITCLAGINGMQPNVSLSYNSQAGNGIAGWGWNLNAFSMIARVPHNHYFDSKQGGVIWDKTSPLALDGSRLLQVREYGTDSIIYRTENENMTRIVGYDIVNSGPKTFKVYTPNGNVMEYGSMSSDFPYFVVANSGAFPRDGYRGKRYLGWALTKVTDNNGNYMEYDYTATVDGASTSKKSANHRLSKIKYGGNSKAGTGHFAEIIFKYEDRPDIETKFIDGCSILNSLRLSDVVVQTSGGSLINRYAFVYETDTYSFLSEIKRSNASGEFLNPIKFKWSGTAYNFTNGGKVTVATSSKHTQILSWGYTLDWVYKYYGDYDGDGITDLVAKHRYKKGGEYKYYFFFYKNNKNGYFTYLYSRECKSDDRCFFFDRDGDGKPEIFLGSTEKDFVMIHQHLGENHYSHSYKCITYKDNKLNWPSEFDFKTEFSTERESKEAIAIPGNFTGSGDLQLIYFNKDLNYQTNYGISQLNKSNVDFGNGVKEIQITDINGNGKSELFFLKDDCAEAYEYNKEKAGFDKIFSINNLNRKKDGVLVGDFNGDGNTDLLVFNSSTGWSVWMSNGRFVYKDSNWDTKIKPATNYSSEKDNVLVFDVNGDGKSDLLHFRLNYKNGSASDSRMELLVNNGKGFDIKIKDDGHPMWDFNNICNYDKSLRKDVGFKSSGFTSTEQRYYSFCKDVVFYKMIGVQNSMGNVLNINYETYKNPTTGYYKKQILSQDGLVYNAPNEFEVVSEVKGGLTDLKYVFSGPVMHKKGKGFLGFKQVEKRDNLIGIKEILENSLNTTYYFLQASKKKVFTTSGSGISEQSFTNSVTKQYPKGYKLTMDKIVQRDFLSGTSTTKTYTYDNYQNVLTEKIDYSGKGTVLSENEYYPSAMGAWYPNRIASTSVKYTRGGESISRKTTFKYNANGLIIKETLDPGDANQVVTDYLDYTDFGNPCSVKLTAAGCPSQTKKYSYSKDGRFVMSETNALGQITSFQYDAKFGLITQKKGPNGLITTYEYDTAGKPKRTIYPDGKQGVSVLRWNGRQGPPGSLYYSYSEVSGDSPQITWYDSYGRSIRKETYGFNGRKLYVDTKYKSNGKVDKVSDPYYADETPAYSSLEYDVYGRETKRVLSTGDVTTIAYNGLELTVSDSRNSSTKTMNAFGNVLINTDNKSGQSVAYSYYPNGNLKSAKPSTGPEVTMEYDLQGNRTKLIDPDAGTISSKYNGLGALIWQEDARKKRTTNTYDAAGRLKSTTRTDAPSLDYTYNNMGQIEKVSGGGHSMAYVYDKYSRPLHMTETIDKKIFKFSNEYDQYGRLSKKIYPTGFAISHHYDKYGNLMQVKQENGSLLWQAEDVNALGQMLRMKQGNNAVTQFDFDSKHRLTSINAGALMHHEYDFADNGNLNYRWDKVNGQKEIFAYDNLNRLTDWDVYQSSDNYSRVQKENAIIFEANGNIKTKSDLNGGNGFKFNYGQNAGPHALTSITNANSSIKSKQDISYNAFGKASYVKVYAEDGSLNKELDLFYGVDDQRRKAVFYDKGSLKQTKYYLGDYEEELSEGKSRKIHYIYGGNGLAAIYLIDGGSENIYYTHLDYQGSLMALSDSQGNVIEKFAYDPWGNRRNPEDWTQKGSLSALKFSRGYTMHEHLDGFGLINMNGRIYDPLVSRFVSPDPFIQASDLSQNFNRYSYCLNNPMVYTDPSGEIVWFIPVVFGAMLNATIQGASGNLGSYSKLFKSLAVGAASGYAGAWAGGLVGGSVGFVSGATSGAAGGFAGGFVSGTGNAWSNGASFEQGFKQGVVSGGLGAATGGLIGGISGGINAIKHNGKFWDGDGAIFDEKMDVVKSNTITEGEDMEYSQRYGQKFSDENFGKNPKNVANMYSDATLPPGYTRDVDIVYNPKGEAVLGSTQYFKGGSNVFLYKAAFVSKEQLYLTMGHEYLHAAYNPLSLSSKREHASIYRWQALQAKKWGFYKANYYAKLSNRFSDFYNSAHSYSTQGFFMLEFKPF